MDPDSGILAVAFLDHLDSSGDYSLDPRVHGVEPFADEVDMNLGRCRIELAALPTTQIARYARRTSRTFTGTSSASPSRRRRERLPTGSDRCELASCLEVTCRQGEFMPP